MSLLLLRRMKRIFLGTGTPLGLGTNGVVSIGATALASSKLNNVTEIDNTPIIRNPLPNVIFTSQDFAVIMSSPLQPACIVRNLVVPTVFELAVPDIRIQNLSPLVEITAL
jgi:hypothetical protein